MSNIIDSLYSNTAQLLKQLEATGDLSMLSFANENLRKVLLLSAASWYETRISEAILKFASVHSNGHSGIQSVIKKKAVDRQYHTHFNWKDRTAGPFYSLLGPDCSKELKQEIGESEELQEAVKCFIELGALRNELVHENFAAYPFDKTAEDVFALVQSAERFVFFLETRLADPHFGRPKSEGSSAQ